MTRCRDIEDQLSPYVDDELNDVDAGIVRAHLATCAACAGIVADLERLTAAARGLGPLPPPPFLYGRIEKALASPPPAGAAAPQTVRSPWRWAAAAAAVLALVSAGATTTWWSTRGTAPASTASPATGLAAVAAELDLAVHHYERAIAELEAATGWEGGLDPELARSIRASLITLDRAITESRQVLVDDPSDELARVSLFEALRRKVDLLQATVFMVGDGVHDPRGTTVPVGRMGSEL